MTIMYYYLYFADEEKAPERSGSLLVGTSWLGPTGSRALPTAHMKPRERGVGGGVGRRHAWPRGRAGGGAGTKMGVGDGAWEEGQACRAQSLHGVYSLV